MERTCQIAVKVAGRTYRVKIEPDEDGGYVADVAGLPGCVTQGETLDEVRKMARDAVAGWEQAYREMARKGVRVPRGCG